MQGAIQVLGFTFTFTCNIGADREGGETGAVYFFAQTEDQSGENDC